MIDIIGVFSSFPFTQGITIVLLCYIMYFLFNWDKRNKEDSQYLKEQLKNKNEENRQDRDRFITAIEVNRKEFLDALDKNNDIIERNNNRIERLEDKVDNLTTKI